MPLLVVGSALVILSITAVALYIKKRNIRLDQRGVSIALFALGLLSLIISLKLFWNMGAYADEHGASPVLISGGWFWLGMSWIKQGLLALLCVVSGLRLIRPS